MISYGFNYRKDPFTGRRAFHSGLDLVATPGTRVAAPADGIVIRARRETGYGNVVYISHGNGITTRFGHLRAFNVRAGEKIRRGDIIGQVGNTGRSLGYHLHYEVLVQGTKVDPMNYILDDDHVSGLRLLDRRSLLKPCHAAGSVLAHYPIDRQPCG